MHREQQDFCERVKQRFPQYFKCVSVADVGSMDINGNNRYLFEESEYIGIDVAEGNNVDIVMPAHTYQPDKQFNVIISTEALEHDKYWVQTFEWMIYNVESGGLIIMTCASQGRAEHGTKRTGSESLSPGSSSVWGDYYFNLNATDFGFFFDMERIFSHYSFEFNGTGGDLYFWGIKK